MIRYYLRLLRDEERIRLIRRAIEAAVRPDDVVVDLGCGIGTFAFFAARAGARRVIGVDWSDAIEFARELALANEIDIELLHGDARELSLPEPATVLIFENFSSAFFNRDVADLLNGVIKRWMAPGFRTIPEALCLRMSLFESDEIGTMIDPWADSERDRYGLDLDIVRRASANSLIWRNNKEPIDFLTAAAVLREQRLDQTIPYRWSEARSLSVRQAGRIDGICLWLDLEFGPEAIYSNAPHATKERSWGQMMLPAFESIPVSPGENVDVSVTYESRGGEDLWRWEIRVGGRIAAGNTFAGAPFTPERLAGYAPERKPRLTERAKMNALILGLVDGERSLAEIAETVQQRTGLDAELALEKVIGCLEGETMPQ